MFRAAELQDKPEFIKLWQNVFHDDAAFAEMVFDRFAGTENIFVSAEEHVNAMLSAVPCTFQKHKGYYWYGLATEPSFEKKGIMTGLMQFASEELKKRGAEFFCLIPASEALFEFYRKRGFQNAFAKRVLFRNIKRNMWAHADFDSVPVRELLTLRKRYFESNVLFDEKRMVDVVTEYYHSGATIISTGHAYGLYFEDRDELHFIEMAADSEREAEYLLEAARDRTGRESATIEVGADQVLFLGEGKRKEYGMISFTSSPFDISEGYMRLMMD